ncbi:unnamed protein product [Chironomus riparius]|uniref:Uncharacterized protein n=1 Tax=Chironomus riparius TaxID=315576 RepID=A0A9N9WXE9_9DIPT|nr:unnamed protein product [Chironomus riparius]
MHFTFIIVPLFAFLALSFASPIDFEHNQIEADEIGLIINDDSDLNVENLVLNCQPRPCDTYCKKIGFVYGRCQFGNCHCKAK